MTTQYKRVFITGGAGFIGRCIAQRFLQEGTEVCGIDMVAYPEFGVVKADLMSPNTYAEMLKDCDAVVHTAAVVSNALSWDATWNVNVAGTKGIMDACIEAGTIKRFLHLSSTATLGFEATSTMDETSPLKTTGHPYRDSKILSEHLVLNYHTSGKLNTTIVRPSDVYGPGSRPWAITPAEEIKRDNFKVPPGMFGPVYIDDLVEGVYLATAKDEGAGNVFIISGFGEVSNEDFFGHHARALGKSGINIVNAKMAIIGTGLIEKVLNMLGKTTEINPNTIRMLNRPCSDYSHQKAREMLGYSPKVTLEEGMQRTLKWLGDEGYLN